MEQADNAKELNKRALDLIERVLLKHTNAMLEQFKESYMAERARAEKAESALSAAQARLAEIREVWAGAEVGEPVHAQEAYAIRLCKQMYQIAVDALASSRQGEVV